MAHGNIDPIDVPEEGPANTRTHKGNGPRGRIDKPGADSKREGGCFIIGSGLHGKTPAGILKKSYKYDKQHNRKDERPEIDGRYLEDANRNRFDRLSISGVVFKNNQAFIAYNSFVDYLLPVAGNSFLESELFFIWDLFTIFASKHNF